MTTVIALHPNTERGGEILNQLEERTHVRPQETLQDGTRRYRIDAPNVNVDAFDSTLDEIDSDWRSHIGWPALPT